MNQQYDLVGPVVEVAHDLLNEDMDETLLGPRIRGRCIPCRWQIVAKLRETCAIDLWARRRRSGQLFDSALKPGHSLQCAVPTRLQLAGDVTLLRIYQFI